MEERGIADVCHCDCGGLRLLQKLITLCMTILCLFLLFSRVALPHLRIR